VPATFYDPETAPDPAEWLGLSEMERIRVAQNFHLSARIKLPNTKVHAVIHAIVENQVATGFGPTCRAIKRLQSQGLSRHEAVHAVGSVVTEFAYQSLQNPQMSSAGDSQIQMNDAIERLTADAWRSSSSGSKGVDG
jgi:hypothetical protein